MCRTTPLKGGIMDFLAGEIKNKIFTNNLQSCKLICINDVSACNILRGKLNLKNLLTKRGKRVNINVNIIKHLQTQKKQNEKYIDCQFKNSKKKNAMTGQKDKAICIYRDLGIGGSPEIHLIRHLP